MKDRVKWLGEQVGWFLGIIASLAIMLLLLPLIPVFIMFEDIRKLHDEG